MLVPHFARQPKPRGRMHIAFPGWGRGTGGREQSWDEEWKEEVSAWGMDRTRTLESPEKGYSPSAAYHHRHHSTSVPNCTPSLYFPTPYFPPMVTASPQSIPQPHLSHSYLLAASIPPGYPLHVLRQDGRGIHVGWRWRKPPGVSCWKCLRS